MGEKQSKLSSKTNTAGDVTIQCEWPASSWKNLASFKVGESITEELKVVSANEKHSFDVRIYPHGFNKSTENVVSLWLKKKSETEVNVKLCCSFMVGDGKELVRKTSRKDLVLESVLGWGAFCSRFAVLNDAFSDLRDQSLRLMVEMTVYGPQSMPNPELEDHHDSSLRELSKEFLHFYTDNSCTDIEIQAAENIRLSVHKAILASRCDVFRQSFLHNMTALCMHSPVDANFLETVMKYIYSGKVDNLCAQDAERVYSLAHSYKLFALKEVCRKLIAGNLSVDNAVKILLMAHKHDDYELEESCLEFIDENLRFVKGKPDWIKLMSNFSTLADKALFFRDKRKSSNEK